MVIRQETTAIESLLTIEGIRFLFTSMVSNFSDFSVVAVILVAMLGVGVAEESGLMGALIRKLVSRRTALGDHVDHRVRRDDLERRLRRRLPHPDPLAAQPSSASASIHWPDWPQPTREWRPDSV